MTNLKTLKFREHLVPLILSGAKDVTWRFFDEKDLRVGDLVSLINWNTLDEFGRAEIVNVTLKPYRTLTDEDRVGHEPLSREQETANYKEYYGGRWNEDSEVKIVKFVLK